MDAYFLISHAEAERHRLLKAFVVVLYCIIFAAVTFIFITLFNKGVGVGTLAQVLAFMFVLLTLPITISDVTSHLSNFHRPELQKYLVRILLMIPIYTITACLTLTVSLAFQKYLTSFRGLYEAYVIWSFTYFLMTYLGPTEDDLSARLAAKRQQKHLFPFRLVLSDWKMGDEILYHCKFGTLQYVVWKTITVFISLFVSLEFRISPLHASFWIMLVTSCSQMLAIYSLVLFYFSTKDDLKPLKPFPKFACIKAVVFFSFWQEVLISFLVQIHVIKSTEFLQASDYGSEIQDFIICVEMLFFAIAHHYAFSYADFATYALSTTPVSGPPTISSTSALVASAHVGDLIADIRRFGNDIRQGATKFRTYGSSSDIDNGSQLLDEGE